MGHGAEIVSGPLPFLVGSEALDFAGVSVAERYDWTEKVLVRFKYYELKQAEKGVMRRYLEKVSGYSRAQISRLIRQYNQTGQLRKTRYRRHRFARSYTTADVALLCEQCGHIVFFSAPVMGLKPEPPAATSPKT